MQDGPDGIFRTALADGKFMIQKCGDCGTHVYHPRVLCTECGSAHLGWVKPSGRGTVYSTTVVRQRPEKGDNYNVCLVDLEEGPRVMSRVETIDPESVRIGMAVEAFVGEADGQPNIVFRPAGA